MDSELCIVKNWETCPAARLLAEAGLSRGAGAQAVEDAATANHVYPKCAEDGPTTSANHPELGLMCGTYGTPEVIASLRTTARVAKRICHGRSLKGILLRLLA